MTLRVREKILNRNMESSEKSVGESRERFLASIERLTGLLLDRLAQTPGGKLMDEKETRMLGSVVMRSFGVWEKALKGGPRDKRSEQKLERLRNALLEKIDRED